MDRINRGDIRRITGRINKMEVRRWGGEGKGGKAEEHKTFNSLNFFYLKSVMDKNAKWRTGEVREG